MILANSRTYIEATAASQARLHAGCAMGVPQLSLIRGTEITAETLARLFEKMTGKQPTAEEIAAARAKLAERKPSP